MATKHTCGGPVFGRRTAGCPRCEELACGAQPVRFGGGDAPKTTKHTHSVVFGRKVDGCPRCDELKAGAEPVRWNTNRSGYPSDRELREHDCRTSRCGAICTFGDW